MSTLSTRWEDAEMRLLFFENVQKLHIKTLIVKNSDLFCDIILLCQMMDMGIHCVDLLHFLTGLKVKEVVEAIYESTEKGIKIVL